MRNTSHVSVPRSYDDMAEELRAMQAANWMLPPLEVSPCVRLKDSGEIHVWSPFFAERPELCENCDENGNTDPAAWRGRTPHESNLSGKMPTPPPPPPSPAEPESVSSEALHMRAPATPQGVLFHFNYNLYDNNDASMLDSAHINLGVPQDFIHSYQVSSTDTSGFTIAPDFAGMPVEQVVNHMFMSSS